MWFVAVCGCGVKCNIYVYILRRERQKMHKTKVVGDKLEETFIDVAKK